MNWKWLGLIVLPFFLNAQNQEVLFPNLEGTELMEAVVDAYKPIVVLTSANSKDTLFARVYAQNDSLPGIYTQHKVYLDPSLDPTAAAFMDNDPDGINTEHIYPKSKGAEFGNPTADMHHMAPSRIDVNAARGNLPFGDIPDGNTTTWYYLDQFQSTIPGNSTIDQYSEVSSNLFEPREAFKGDIARSIFYFYTMYRSQADIADPNFFDLQREALCEWHVIDPVDEAEWNRTVLIGSYQQDKINPFILDCTLAERMYCQNIVDACGLVNTNTILEAQLELNIAPNPNAGAFNLSYHLASGAVVQLKILDLQGKIVYSQTQWQSSGSHSIPVALPAINTQAYLFDLTISNEEGVVKKSGRIIVK